MTLTTFDDLAIEILVLSCGLLGTILALLGETYDKSEPRLTHRITLIGWSAVVCITLSMIFGGMKILRANDREEELVNSRDEMFELLKHTLHTVGEQELLHSISIEVDATYNHPNASNVVGYNDIVDFFNLVTADRYNGQKLGIKFRITYAPLTIIIYGFHQPGEPEQWFVKIRSPTSQGDYYTADLISFTQNYGYPLIRATLTYPELRPSIPVAIPLSQFHLRAGDTLDPFQDFGRLDFHNLVILPPDSTGEGFANELIEHWPKTDERKQYIPVTLDHIKNWFVYVKLNHRKIDNIGRRSPRYGYEELEERLGEKSLDVPSEPMVILAPHPKDWLPYKSHMPKKIRQVVFGDESTNDAAKCICGD